MWKELRPALMITLVMTLITGILYPLAITGVAQVVFPRQANGSLLEVNGKVIGSELIAQGFARPSYFHPRPSATGNNPYDATASGGSNLGATNPALAKRLKESAEAFGKENPAFTGPIPADALTTSGSGLDPHISPANAMAQAPRVAKERGVPVEQVQELARQLTEERQLGVVGEARVNVLRLNIALDEKYPVKR
jgi:K+-transporting ATPase ATPase C chain